MIYWFHWRGFHEVEFPHQMRKVSGEWFSESIIKRLKGLNKSHHPPIPVKVINSTFWLMHKSVQKTRNWNSIIFYEVLTEYQVHSAKLILIDFSESWSHWKTLCWRWKTEQFQNQLVNPVLITHHPADWQRRGRESLTLMEEPQLMRHRLHNAPDPKESHRSHVILVRFILHCIRMTVLI